MIAEGTVVFPGTRLGPTVSVTNHADEPGMLIITYASQNSQGYRCRVSFQVDEGHMLMEISSTRAWLDSFKDLVSRYRNLSKAG